MNQSGKLTMKEYILRFDQEYHLMEKSDHRFSGSPGDENTYSPVTVTTSLSFQQIQISHQLVIHRQQIFLNVCFLVCSILIYL